jgi:hypothetical protein
MKNKIYEIKKLYVISLSMIILLLSMSLLQANLGTYKQNDCIPIITNLNTSAVNISVLASPSPNSTILLSNVAMTKIGNSFNYTFCNTSKLGAYTYGYCDFEGNCYSNDFLVTSTGYSPSISQSVTMFIIIAILMIVIVLFFIFGITSNYIPIKITCLSLSVILIVFTIGYILQMANITIGEFTSLTNGFTPLYIIFITLLIGGGIGIIVYLIAMVFQQFQKTKYGIGE